MHIIIGFLLGFFLQVVAQLGTNIRYSGAIRTSSTSPPFPLTNIFILIFIQTETQN